MCSGHLLHLLLRKRGLTWHSTFTSVCACACVLTTLIVNVIIYTQSLFIDTAGGDGQGYMCSKGLTGNSNPPVCGPTCTFQPPGCTSGECSEECIQVNCAGVVANNQCYNVPFQTGSEAGLFVDIDTTFPSASACCVPPS